jgi:hypothetical protein
MKMVHDKLTLEDNFTLEKVIEYIENDWSELSPAFQLVIVKWLAIELDHTQKALKEQEEISERYF